jgi:hypothetical protein
MVRSLTFRTNRSASRTNDSWSAALTFRARGTWARSEPDCPPSSSRARQHSHDYSPRPERIKAGRRNHPGLFTEDLLAARDRAPTRCSRLRAPERAEGCHYSGSRFMRRLDSTHGGGRRVCRGAVSRRRSIVTVVRQGPAFEGRARDAASGCCSGLRRRAARVRADGG